MGDRHRLGAVTKAALRARIRSCRAGRDDAALARAGETLAAHAHLLVRPTLAAFASFGGEPPTAPLLAALRAAGVRILLPVLLGDNDLDWADDAGATLGRDAIAEADLVLAPALAVDRAGHRLGQGGGSYDRALPRTTAQVLAVVFDDELLDAVPSEPHDCRVDGVLSPQRGMQWFDRTLKASLP